MLCFNIIIIPATVVGLKQLILRGKLLLHLPRKWGIVQRLKKALIVDSNLAMKTISYARKQAK